MSVEARFWAKVDRRSPNDCWVWLARKNQKGYGQFNVDGKKIYAHRFAFQQANGAIAGGLTIDHLCRNTSCVNPAHLEAVSMRENNRRGESPSAQRARQTVCHRGHPLSGPNLIVVNGHRICRTCRADLHRVLSRKRYAAAEAPAGLLRDLLREIGRGNNTKRALRSALGFSDPHVTRGLRALVLQKAVRRVGAGAATSYELMPCVCEALCECDKGDTG